MLRSMYARKRENILIRHLDGCHPGNNLLLFFYGLSLMSLMEICSFVKEVYISAKGEVSSTWSYQYKAIGRMTCSDLLRVIKSSCSY